MGTATRAVQWVFAVLVVLDGTGRALAAEPGPAAPKAADPAAAAPAGAERGPSPPATPAAPETPATPGAAAGQTLRQGADAAGNPFAPTTNLPAANYGGANAQAIPRLYNMPRMTGLPGAAAPREISPFQQSAMPPNPFLPQPRGGGPGGMFRPAATIGMTPRPVQSVTGQKPGANYQPTSPVSPYMGLYAPRTPGINNYNAYVRPQLQQNAFNQQVEGNFRSLQSTSDLQGASLQQLEQGTQLFQSEGGPASATFMDYGAYYPGRTAPPPKQAPSIAPRVTR
jgi:hypothetical protein